MLCHKEHDKNRHQQYKEEQKERKSGQVRNNLVWTHLGAG